MRPRAVLMFRTTLAGRDRHNRCSGTCDRRFSLAAISQACRIFCREVGAYFWARTLLAVLAGALPNSQSPIEAEGCAVMSGLRAFSVYKSNDFVFALQNLVGLFVWPHRAALRVRK